MELPKPKMGFKIFQFCRNLLKYIWVEILAKCKWKLFGEKKYSEEFKLKYICNIIVLLSINFLYLVFNRSMHLIFVWQEQIWFLFLWQIYAKGQEQTQIQKYSAWQKNNCYYLSQNVSGVNLFWPYQKR